MYVASYNDVPHTKGNYKLGATYRETSYPGYIYTLNGKQSTISNSDYYTGDNTLDNQGYNNMYSKSSYWWLASPSSSDSNDVCNVIGRSAFLFGGSYYDDRATGVGPLVSLPSTFTVEVEQ